MSMLHKYIFEIEGKIYQETITINLVEEIKLTKRFNNY